MKSIRKIIRETIRDFLKENDEELYGLYDAMLNIKSEILNEFIYKNNQDFTKNISWRVVPFQRLKKIWEDYIKLGFVRDEKGLDMIEKIIIRNALKLNAITELAGHTSYSPDEEFNEIFGTFIDEQINCIIPPEKVDTSQLEIPYENPSVGYKQKEPIINEPCRVEINPYIQKFIKEHFDEETMNIDDLKNVLMDELIGKFHDYFIEDPKSGQAYFSDYGLEPIIKLISNLYVENNLKEKIVLIDKILNVVHQRSDLASWFVQGGSYALSDLSGYEIPDEEAGGYDTKSAISGRYKMSDYR